ncbi:MAG: HD domain-containing protein [Firmicutes bacterium]|jgi:3'-5' exoribonuclease|nr:HD domain-containing protein [Clostridiales bacterium]MBQ6608761.1 HD domain-containing protein [Bacillota bacterium]MBR3182754.1 HD domain-containing protein [Bacillota bacterium]MBR3259967.1 HD domain-containing protein [Bacillota bacterium]MBR3375606.1 HD domain-containing protein [Bacillota bacterium]
MKQIFVKDLKKEMEVIDFFMVKSVAVKTGSTGKPYLDVVLGDNTGEINGKKWDVGTSDHLLKEKDIVKIIAVVTEFNSQLQLKIQRIRKAVPESNPDDIMDMGDFVKAAPEDPEEMYDYIFRSCDSIKDEDYRKLCLRVLEDNREKLMYYPAASKNHHAELGGLLYHTKRMLMNGERVCQVYTNLNKDLVIAGVVLHDIQKIFEIDADTDGMASGYSFEGQMLGHIVMGVKYIDKLADETDLPYEKKIMMEHMVLSHHYEPEFGSPKKPLFPEAEVLHYLDILDARMYDMEEAVAHTEPGGFSDRIWTLDNRRIYNPTK